jgi:hypothetical protein
MMSCGPAAQIALQRVLGAIMWSTALAAACVPGELTFTGSAGQGGSTGDAGAAASGSGGSAAGGSAAGGGATGGSATGGDATGGSATGGGGAGSTYRAEVLLDAPVAYWRFGEASGPVAASEVGTGMNGVYAGAVTFSVEGAIAGDTDTAVELDGDGAYVLVGDVLDFPNAAPFSLEAWVKPASLPTAYEDGIISKRDYVTGGGQGYTLRVLSSEPAGTVGVSFVRDGLMDGAYGGPPLVLGTFTHVVATFDGSVVRLYLDGTIVSSDIDGVPTLVDNSSELVIGMEGATEYFHGVIDEVAVYDHALAPLRVAAHFLAGTGGRKVFAPHAIASSAPTANHTDLGGSR